jgi:hypothetical protein
MVQLHINLTDYVKRVPNTGTVASLKLNSTDSASLLVNLVVLEFVVC